MADRKMIEKVARALAGAHTGVPTTWKLYAEDARTVIAAMREPMEAMVPGTGVPAGLVDGCERILDQDVARHAWQAMIDAALAD